MSSHHLNIIHNARQWLTYTPADSLFVPWPKWFTLSKYTPASGFINKLVVNYYLKTPICPAAFSFILASICLAHCPLFFTIYLSEMTSVVESVHSLSLQPRASSRLSLFPFLTFLLSILSHLSTASLQRKPCQRRLIQVRGQVDCWFDSAIGRLVPARGTESRTWRAFSLVVGLKGEAREWEDFLKKCQPYVCVSSLRLVIRHSKCEILAAWGRWGAFGIPVFGVASGLRLSHLPVESCFILFGDLTTQVCESQFSTDEAFNIWHRRWLRFFFTYYTTYYSLPFKV